MPPHRVTLALVSEPAHRTTWSSWIWSVTVLEDDDDALLPPDDEALPPLLEDETALLLSPLGRLADELLPTAPPLL